MKRLERLEKKGWKVSIVLGTGNVVISKGLIKKVFESITQAHKWVFGY